MYEERQGESSGDKRQGKMANGKWQMDKFSLSFPRVPEVS